MLRPSEKCSRVISDISDYHWLESFYDDENQDNLYFLKPQLLILIFVSFCISEDSKGDM